MGSNLPTAKRSWRSRFPIIVFVLIMVGLAVLWGWPTFDLMPRVAGTLMVASVAVLTFLGWVLFLSAWRWGVRLGVVGGLVLAAVAIVSDVRFSGDMVPIVDFRWQFTRHDAVNHFLKTVSQKPIDEPIKDVTDVDFPAFRGLARDGIVNGPPLARDWSKQPPEKMWRHPCGGGYAAFAIVGNLAVTIEQRGDDEAIVCYDARTGDEHWACTYPCHFKETLGGNGPRATPTIDGEFVHGYGATGKLTCVELKTGKLVWSKDTLDGNDNLTWAMSGSPLVYDNVVVVNPGAQKSGKKGQAILAFDKTTGDKVWSTGSTKAGYSSPMLGTLGGVKQLLLFDGEIFAGYDPKVGTQLWNYPWPTHQDINVAQPVVVDANHLFISSGYGVGCALFKIERKDGPWTVDQVWRNKNMRCKFTTAVLRDGYLYGLDEGILVCLDAKTGKRRWKDGRYGHGQLLLSDDLLVILAEYGELVLVEANPEKHVELGKIQAIQGKTWNTPALANGFVYIRNDEEMARYDLRRDRE